MASATELLRLVIDADGKGAVSQFEAIGASADRNLGKTDDKMKKIGAGLTTFGAGLATAGALAGAGLFKLAMMSEDAEMQSRKLANSVANSEHVFRSNGAALEEQAKALQQVTAADADAVIGAQSLLVQFGATESQVQSLTPLMVDLSRKMGVDLDTAAKAIGKSVNGSSGALKKMGIVVDEAKFAIDPFNATVEAMRSTVGGFAQQEGATFSGQIEILKNNLGDLGEAIGGGASGVLSGFVEKIGQAANYLGNVNPELGNTVGKLGAIASVASIGAGGISMVAGQVIKLRTAFTVLGDDGTRSLTNVGKAASGVAVAGAVVAGWMALDAIMTNIAEDSVAIATGLDRMKAASDEGQALDALTEQAVRFDTWWEDAQEGFLSSAPLIGDVSKALGLLGVSMGDTAVDIKGTTVEVKDVEQALGDLAAAGEWEQLTLILDALESSGADLEGSGLNEVIDGYRERVQAAGEASAVAIPITEEAAGAYESLGVTIDEAASAYEAYSSAILGSVNSMVGMTEAAAGLHDAQVKVVETTAEVTRLEAEGKAGTDEYAKAVDAQSKANWDAAKSAIKQQEAVQKLSADLESGKISTDAATAAVADLAASGAITTKQADVLSFAIAAASAKADELGRKNPKPTVDADTGGFWAKVLPAAAWNPPKKTGKVDADARGFWDTVFQVDRWQPPRKTLHIGAVFHGEGAIGKAIGGPVSAAHPYIVGEKGPELFVPNQSGTIVPNHQLGSAAGTPVGGGSTHLHFHGPVARDAEGWLLDVISRANRSGRSAIAGVR